MKTPVYFDNAATTPIRNEVIEVITSVLKNNYGNASSTHSFGRSSRSLIEKNRKEIAAYFNVTPAEIIFTSGGTEADNLVLRSAARDLGVKTFITSKIEHNAILHTLNQLSNEYDITVRYVDIDEHGELDYQHLEHLLETNHNVLTTLMYVNNEIGNLLDIEYVANLCKKHKALFHSDTVQAIGHYDIDLSKIPIDFLAASAHKFHGPKGVGFAFIRKDSGLKPIIFGGEQERGFRAGTECVHNIAGLAEAFKIATTNLVAEGAFIKNIKSYFIRSLKKAVPECSFNGHSGHLEKSAYTSVNVCFPISEEKSAMFLFQLDLKGIACSKGSACQSGSTKKSHVLSAILNEEELSKPSIRFSFSIFNTKEDVDYVVKCLQELVYC